MNKPQPPGHTSVRRYRTQEVAGSSPASSIEESAANRQRTQNQRVSGAKAVLGGDAGPALSTLLPEIARDPHRILIKTEYWVERDRARRVEPTGLIAAFRKAGNVDLETRLPYQVFQGRSMLSAVLEVEGLQVMLGRARLAASFLDDVNPPARLLTKPTMVLLRASVLTGASRELPGIRRTAFVELDDADLETPLENLPHLYESWATLQVIDVLLRVAKELGYTADPPRLARHSDGGLYIKVLAALAPTTSGSRR